MPRMCPLDLHGVCTRLVERAKESEERRAAKRFSEWQSWAVGQADTSGSSLRHKYLKGPVPWAEFDVRDGRGGPQHNAGNRAARWHDVWQVQAQYNQPSWPRDADLPLQGVLRDTQHVRSIANAYKIKTAIG